jgi:hypothetical protein
MIFESVQQITGNHGFDRVKIIECCCFKFEESLSGKKTEQLVKGNETDKDCEGRIAIKGRTGGGVIGHRGDSLQMQMWHTGLKNCKVIRRTKKAPKLAQKGLNPG